MSIFKERKNYKPFEYNFITDPLIDAMWASHWTHNEFTFKSDVQDYKVNLSQEEQELIKRAILMISQVEVSVKSYWANIGRLLPKPEIGDMGAVFGGVEVIHSRAYSEILNKLGLDDEFQRLLSDGVVEKRVSYLKKYVNKIYKDDHKNIIYSLILFTLFTENVSLFSQFYTILGFNRYRGYLKDIANVVQYTSKEEINHALGGIALINQIKIEHPELFDEELADRIADEVQEAVKAEHEIIKWILQGFENEFISEDILLTYVKRRMNDALDMINMQGFRFDLDTEIAEKTLWMDEEIYVPTLTDFFHKKPIDYAKKLKSFSQEELF
jgi:ribonucleoside-diphosphate reductase beta chain